MTLEVQQIICEETIRNRNMSRKGSGKGKKGSAKSPKVQIKELTEQNATLNEELISLKNQHEELRNKMDCTVRKILEGVSRKDFNIKEATDPLDITTDCLLNMVGKMIIKKKIMDMSVEARVEQLETRVTQMTIDIAKYSKKTLAYENGLQDLLNSHNMEDVRDRVYQLQLIAGTCFPFIAWFICVHNDVIDPPHDRRLKPCFQYLSLKI